MHSHSNTPAHNFVYSFKVHNYLGKKKTIQDYFKQHWVFKTDQKTENPSKHCPSNMLYKSAVIYKNIVFLYYY